MIQLKDIVVKFGDFTALHDINVHVKEGEFFTFLAISRTFLSISAFFIFLIFRPKAMLSYTVMVGNRA